MRVVALIMAGGRGKRFGGKIEKPMIKLLGMPLIWRVIEATKASKRISETYVAVTLYNPKLQKKLRRHRLVLLKQRGMGITLTCKKPF